MKKTYIIGFDGLHRAGKGSQIEHLQKYLKSCDIYNVILRGDGTRGGRGPNAENPYDFESVWWRENLGYFKQEPASIEEAISKLNLKSQRLNREIAAYKHCLDRSKSRESGVIILDRTFVSRFFTMRQYVPDITLEESLKLHHPVTKKKVEFAVPDCTFVLHTSKANLMNRIKAKHDGSEKYYFKENIVQNYFELFEEVLNKVKSIPGVNILDANRHEVESHEEVISILSRLIQNGK